jgi:hypothetical protein
MEFLGSWSSLCLLMYAYIVSITQRTFGAGARADGSQITGVGAENIFFGSDLSEPESCAALLHNNSNMWISHSNKWNYQYTLFRLTFSIFSRIYRILTVFKYWVLHLAIRNRFVKQVIFWRYKLSYRALVDKCMGTLRVYHVTQWIHYST